MAFDDRSNWLVDLGAPVIYGAGAFASIRRGVQAYKELSQAIENVDATGRENIEKFTTLRRSAAEVKARTDDLQRAKELTGLRKAGFTEGGFTPENQALLRRYSDAAELSLMKVLREPGMGLTGKRIQNIMDQIRSNPDAISDVIGRELWGPTKISGFFEELDTQLKKGTYMHLTQGSESSRLAGRVVQGGYRGPGVSILGAVSTIPSNRAFNPFPKNLKSKDWKDLSILSFDIEATNLNTDQAKVFQFGATLTKGGKTQKSWNFLINPGDDISKGAIQALGLSKTEVAAIRGAKRNFAESMPDILKAFSEADVISGHNVLGYDIPVLEQEFARAGGVMPKKAVIDSLELARAVVRNESPNQQLQTLAKLFNVTAARAHDAADDARVQSEVLWKLRSRLPSTLEELMALQMTGTPGISSSQIYSNVGTVPGLGLTEFRTKVLNEVIRKGKFESAVVQRREMAGTVSAKGNVGYIDTLQLKKHGRLLSIPMERQTFDPKSGQKLNLFVAGELGHATYVYPQATFIDKDHPKVGQYVDLVDEMFYGSDTSDISKAPILQDIDVMEAGLEDPGNILLKKLRAFEKDEQRIAEYLAPGSLKSPDILAKAIITSKSAIVADAEDFVGGKGGRGRQDALARLGEVAAESGTTLKIASGGGKIGSHLMHMPNGAELYKVDWNPNRRPMQQFRNEWAVNPIQLREGQKFYKTGQAKEGVWRRMASPLDGEMMNSLSKSTGTAPWRYSAAVVLDDALSGSVGLGEGPLYLKGAEGSLNLDENQLAKLYEDRIIDEFSGKGTPTASQMELAGVQARSRARRTIGRMSARPLVGPEIVSAGQYAVTIAENGMNLPTSKIVEDIISGKRKNVSLLPGDVLGLRASATGLDVETVPEKNMYNERITDWSLKKTGSGAVEVILQTEKSMKMREGIGVFNYGKGVTQGLTEKGHRLLAQDLGIDVDDAGAYSRFGTEAITGIGDLKKNIAVLREQQVTGLAQQVASNARNPIDLNIFRKSNFMERLRATGSQVAADVVTPRMSEFLGMVSLSKRAGLTNLEMAEVLAGETRIEKNFSQIYGKHLDKILGSDTETQAFTEALQKQKVVFGQIAVNPAAVVSDKIPNPVTGRGGFSVEPRSLRGVALTFPEEIAGKMIGAFKADMPDVDAELKLAMEINQDPKSFKKVFNLNVADEGAFTTAATELGGLLEGAGPTERIRVKLPESLMPEGFEKIGPGAMDILIPTAEELASLEAPMRLGSRPNYIPYLEKVKRTLKNINEWMLDPDEVSGERARAGAISLLEDRVGYERSFYKQKIANKMGGSGSGWAASYISRGVEGNLLPPPPTKNPAVVYLSDQMFENTMDSAKGYTKEYTKKLRKRFATGDSVAMMFSRHPHTGTQGIQPVLIQRRPDRVLNPNAPRYGNAAMAYIPHTSEKINVPGMGVVTEDISFYRAMSAQADADKDLVQVKLFPEGKTEAEMKSWLQSPEGIEHHQKMRDVAVQKSIAARMWKSAVRGDGPSVAKVMSSQKAFMDAAGGMANIADVGRLSNSLDYLTEAVAYLPEKSRNSWVTLLSALEDAPIGAKHGKGTQSVALLLSEAVEDAFSNAGETFIQDGVSRTSGERLVLSMKSIIKNQLSSTDDLSLINLFSESGVELTYGDRATTLSIGQQSERDMAASIDQRIESMPAKASAARRRHIAELRSMTGGVNRGALETYEGMQKFFNTLKEGEQSQFIADQVVANPGHNVAGVPAAHLASQNEATLTRGAAKALGSIKKRWLHISKPMLASVAVTSAVDYLFGSPGYDKTPLPPNGAMTDPRILAAIRQGNLLDGGKAARMETRGMSKDAKGEATAIRQQMNADVGVAMDGHSSDARIPTQKVAMPTARVGMPPTTNYSMNMSAGSSAEAQAMAARVQTSIPNSRVGVYLTNNRHGMITNRPQDNL